MASDTEKRVKPSKEESSEKLNGEEKSTSQDGSENLFGVWTKETVGEKKYKVLLYGASGSGKTYMAGTFPRPLFLDLEDGMRTVLQQGKEILRYPKDPNQSLVDYREIVQFYSMVKKINPEEAPFETIVIDSLNELQILMLKNIVNQNQANRLYTDQPTMGDYGALARDMQKVVRLFLQLPYHVVMTAVSTDREYEDDTVYPMFIGKKTGPDLRRIIEQIGYTFTIQNKGDDIKYVVGFQNCPAYLAKDRTGKLTKIIPNSYQAMSKER